jgi:hypothetical protein
MGEVLGEFFISELRKFVLTSCCRFFHLFRNVAKFGLDLEC